jgi:hypothetical protein
LAEIVAGHVAPDRALADHAFGQAILARAGVIVAVGSGPLVVAPDLARGVPSNASMRAGRALALQVLAVAIARGNGLPDDQIVVGGLTSWLAGEPEAASRAVAEVALRRALLPRIGLVFEEPRPDGRAGAELWPEIVAAVQPPGWTTAVVRRRPTAAAVRATRIQAIVAAEIAAAYADRSLSDGALAHARATSATALRTLEGLADEGWRSVMGDGPESGVSSRLGADAVAERSEPFDPLGAELSRIG